MAAPTLRRNFAWSFAGNATFALSQWLIVIAIAKLGTPRDVGDWTLALAITGPVFIFFQLKLRQFQATDVRGEHRWSEYLALRLIAVSVALAVSFAIAAVGVDESILAVTGAIALMKAFDATSDVVYGHHQQHERMHRVGIALVARGVSGTIVATIVLWATDSLAWTAFALAGVYAGWLVSDFSSMDLPSSERRGPSRDIVAVATLARRVLPLGFVTAIGALQVNIPRYFLEAHVSREQLGLFGSLSYLLFTGGVIAGALATAAAPRLARFAAGGHWSSFRRQLLQLVGMGALLGVGGFTGSLLFGEPVLRLVYSDEYARHADVLVWLSVSSGLTWTYVFLGTALDAMRRYGVQPLIHVVSSLVIVAFAALLVPVHGMLGAAWAMVAGYGAEFVMYLIAVTITIRTSEAESIGVR